MRLESGPANYDRNYNLIIMLLGVFFGAYFLYDHTIGYPQKNRVTAEQALIPRIGAERIPDKLPEKPTETDCKNEVKNETTEPDRIHELWGTPLFAASENGTIYEYYPSAYGMAVVPIIGKYVDFKKIRWEQWEKSADDIQMQLYCSIASFLFALFFLYRVIKAATLKVVIDDEGLVYAGRRVPFDNMTKFTNYSKKGWVDLFYKLGTQERKIRFDNQKVRKFNEIIDALCRAKGFADPRKEVEEDDASEAQQKE